MKELFFAYYFYRYEVSEWHTKKEKLLKILEKRELGRDYVDIFYSDRFLNEKSYVNDVNALLSNELNSFYKDCEQICTITDCWTVKYKKGDHQTAHNHRSWGYSAILYLNYDPCLHSPTHFICPWTHPGHDKTFISTPDIKEGTLYIFPSNIYHFAIPNKSDKERIIISFDLLPNV